MTINLSLAELKRAIEGRDAKTLTAFYADDALLRIPAGATLEADDRGIPTGVEVPVQGTNFDFRNARPVGPLRLDTAFTRRI